MGDNTKDTKDTEDGGLVSLADLSHIKLKELADDDGIHQTPKTSTVPSLVFRLQPKKPSTELLGSSDTAVLDWLVAQLEQDSANSQDEQYIRDLKKDFLSLKEDVAQTVFSRLIDSVSDVLPKINQETVQETVQIEGGQEFPMLYQPTKIPMSSDNIALMKAKYEELSDKLNIELEKFNRLSESLVAEDYKNLDQLIFILKIILQLGQLDETRKIDTLNKLTENTRDKITRVELAVTKIAKLDQLSRERIIQKLSKKEDALKKSTLDAKQNLPVNMQVLERLTEIETLKEFLADIKKLDLTSEPELRKTLNSGLIYFNNVKFQILDEEPTKALFDKLTVLKKNIRSMVSIKKQTESLKKFIDVVDLIQDKAHFQKTLQDKEKQYQQLSKEKIDDKIEHLQQLLKEFLSKDLETFKRIIAIFDAMLENIDVQHAKYNTIKNTKENYVLIYKFLNSMLESTDNLQYLKDLLLNDSVEANSFNTTKLQVFTDKAGQYAQLFGNLGSIKQLVQEIFSVKDELVDLEKELEELRKFQNYQVVFSTSEALHTESDRTVPKESYKALSLSEIITQLGKLEKHYDQQQYKVLTHNIEVFLSNLQYTIDIVSKNFSTNAELMTSLPNILSKVQAIQTKLAAMHSDEPPLAKKAPIDFRK